MTSRRLILVAFACGVVLWTLFGQLNHYLSDWHISLFVGGLLVTFRCCSDSSRFPINLSNTQLNEVGYKN
ncbi:MAG: hypothetical protein QM760_17945, partial [Nibricoccus sp.]